MKNKETCSNESLNSIDKKNTHNPVRIFIDSFTAVPIPDKLKHNLSLNFVNSLFNLKPEKKNEKELQEKKRFLAFDNGDGS